MDFPDASTLDTSGLLCPEPVMMLHNKIRDIAVGDMIELIATDPSTERDVPKFCAFLGHKLVDRQERDKKYFYYIEKAATAST
ncbi:sulfurtransferase TusA [Oceanicoccus sagamiensis]|uniref:Sulfurtransferase TusA n=1 Tax=Oceanicoccus sagamiensis TaxID=716816 RepID=A0A1X9NCZ3_9GAMM|nr:sulfurtransferase TusA [Oceanicoccus sagamiensis]ARN75900.1 sulfurtransferase TusA [Oceanicoccus sagamiensis]